MKVIQTLPEMKSGGVERGVLDLVSFFQSQESSSGIKSVVISAGGPLLYLLDSWKVPHYQVRVERKSLLSFFAIPKVAKIILKEKADIVHARSRVPAWISFFASRNKECQFITTAHGMYKNKFSSEVMGWGKFVICPSKVVARHMKINFGVPEEKIVIIPRWVDLNKFPFIDYEMRLKSNTIVSVGRISPSKGYEHLIKAFCKVVRHYPYAKLKIVGSVDKAKNQYLNQLKTLVTRFSLNYNVEFTGFCQDIGKVLAEARILVVPSLIKEAFGRVAIEAAACGVPVVATKVGALSEIIESDQDGVLVEPADPEALAKAILRLFENPSLASKFSKSARKKVETRYTMQQSLTKLEEVYKQSITQKRILLIKISSLGDVILAIPSLVQLRKEFPEAKIHLLTLKKYANLFYDCPYLDKVIAVSSDYRKIKESFKIAKRLRRLAFDYIIDLQNNRATQLISFFSFPRKSFGFKRKLGFLLHDTAEYKKKEKISPLDSQEKILKLAGVKSLSKELKFWETGPVPVSGFNLTGDKLIGLSVSASLGRPTKNWPHENINQFIKLFLKEYPDYTLILIGDESSKKQSEMISAFHKAKKVIDLCGKTKINELIEVLKKLKVFIAPDTATLHLAQSLGVDTIGLFGPTNPKIHTVEADNLYIIEKNLSCSYCYKNKCLSCACMNNILPKEVLQKVKSILKNKV